MSVDKAFEEIKRLKIKCNTYAKRLVLEGFDDVEWEITPLDPDAPSPYAGQKTLSPEVITVVQYVIWELKQKPFNDFSNVIFRLEKLLEGGE